MTSVFNGIQHGYFETIQKSYRVAGGVRQYLENYLVQLENMLQNITVCRQKDLLRGLLSSILMLLFFLMTCSAALG